MKKLISFLTIFLIALFLLSCTREIASNQTDVVEAPTIEKEALSSPTNIEGEKEVEISPEELPAVIKTAIEATYTGAELLEADHITRPDGSTYYDVEIKHNDQQMELMYESDGSFLGIEEEGEEDDDDEDDDDDGE